MVAHLFKLEKKNGEKRNENETNETTTTKKQEINLLHKKHDFSKFSSYNERGFKNTSVSSFYWKVSVWLIGLEMKIVKFGALAVQVWSSFAL